MELTNWNIDTQTVTTHKVTRKIHIKPEVSGCPRGEILLYSSSLSLLLTVVSFRTLWPFVRGIDKWNWWPSLVLHFIGIKRRQSANQIAYQLFMGHDLYKCSADNLIVIDGVLSSASVDEVKCEFKYQKLNYSTERAFGSADAGYFQ